MPPISKKRKAYNRAHKAEQHEYKLKRNYGITMEDYKAMMIAQHGNCALCGRPQVELKEPFIVDHDHTTGFVRGLLCNNCNHGLGRFRDSIPLLQTAISYLFRAQLVQMDWINDELIPLESGQLKPKEEENENGTNRPEG